jgi:hypothetical protein
MQALLDTAPPVSKSAMSFLLDVDGLDRAAAGNASA